MSAALTEEIEILESIYPEELTKVSDIELAFHIQPDEPQEAEEDQLTLQLHLVYPERYPDVLPEMSLECVTGELSTDEERSLLDHLRTLADENLATAMTFALVASLREEVSTLVSARLERRKKEELEREKEALAAEEARTRGTPVTRATFAGWKENFDRESRLKRQREEEERLKGLTPKEREEFKKLTGRLSGRALFERDRNLATSDASLLEEGTTSVDLSQYDRTQREDEEDQIGVEFSDSD